MTSTHFFNKIFKFDCLNVLIFSPLMIMQMPRGVPVATVAINNATNAGLLAVRMLGIRDADLLARWVFFLFPYGSSANFVLGMKLRKKQKASGHTSCHFLILE